MTFPTVFFFMFVPLFQKQKYRREILCGNEIRAESSAPHQVTVPSIFCGEPTQTRRKPGMDFGSKPFHRSVFRTFSRLLMFSAPLLICKYYNSNDCECQVFPLFSLKCGHFYNHNCFFLTIAHFRFILTCCRNIFKGENLWSTFYF